LWIWYETTFKYFRILEYAKKLSFGTIQVQALGTLLMDVDHNIEF